MFWMRNILQYIKDPQFFNNMKWIIWISVTQAKLLSLALWMLERGILVTYNFVSDLFCTDLLFTCRSSSADAFHLVLCITYIWGWMDCIINILVWWWWVLGNENCIGICFRLGLIISACCVICCGNHWYVIHEKNKIFKLVLFVA